MVADDMVGVFGEGTVFNESESKISGLAVEEFSAASAAVTENIALPEFPEGEGEAETELCPFAGGDGVIGVTVQTGCKFEGFLFQEGLAVFAVIEGIHDFCRGTC